jgi:hypothetical protein
MKNQFENQPNKLVSIPWWIIQLNFITLVTFIHQKAENLKSIKPLSIGHQPGNAILISGSPSRKIIHFLRTSHQY